MGEVQVVPAGFRRVGQVRAQCVLTERRGSIEQEWLSDVDCTERRLAEALREEAAQNGGELLVGRTCRASRLTGHRLTMRCEAGVARALEPGHETRQRFVPDRSALDDDDPSGAEAWRIRVHFEPAIDPAARAARRADTVDEVAVLPVAAQLLGALWVRCEHAPCSIEAVRAGVRVSAGRLGATHVAQVRCVDVNDTPSCLGEAGMLEELPPSFRAVP